MSDIPYHALVVVTDGHQGTLYKNTSRDGDVSLEKLRDIEPSNLLDDGPAGARPTESSPKETDEATFAKQVAEYLNAEALANNFEALVLIADPGTLGQIRPSLHQEVEQRMVKEIDKTLTNSPIEDIEKCLSD